MKHLTHYDPYYKNVGSNSVLIHILKYFIFIGDAEMKERLGFGLVFRQNEDETCQHLKICLDFWNLS